MSNNDREISNTIGAPRGVAFMARGAYDAFLNTALAEAGLAPAFVDGAGEALLGLDIDGSALLLLAIAELGAGPAEELCASSARLAGKIGVRMIVTLSRAQIDLAGAYLLGTHAQLLCDPSQAEIREALEIAMRAGRGQATPWRGGRN